MKLLNDESVFMSLLLLAGATWAVFSQPSLFSSLILLVMLCLSAWFIIRMSWFRP